MVDIVDYKPHHLVQIQLKPCHDGERPKEIRGPAITFLRDEIPLAIFGWYFIGPGVVQVWGLVASESLKLKKTFHKSVKALIGVAFQKHSLRRMQISVRCDFHAGWYWAKALGFECEGVMKGYGAGGMNCWLFARVNHDGC